MRDPVHSTRHRRAEMMNQRGSATIALAGSACAIAILGGVALGVGTEVILRHQLRTAVDQAALAAADVSRGVIAGEPCSIARKILSQAGATMTVCDDNEDSVVVQGRTSRGLSSALATARAGIADSGEK